MIHLAIVQPGVPQTRGISSFSIYYFFGTTFYLNFNDFQRFLQDTYKSILTEFFPHFTVNFGQFFEAFTDFFIFLFFYFYPTIDDIQRYVFSYLESIFIHFLTIFFLNFRSILTLLPIFVKFYRIFDDLSTGFFSSLANFSSISDIFS